MGQVEKNREECEVAPLEPFFNESWAPFDILHSSFWSCFMRDLGLPLRAKYKNLCMKGSSIVWRNSGIFHTCNVLYFSIYSTYNNSCIHKTYGIYMLACTSVHSLTSLTCSAHNTVDNNHSQSDLLWVHFIPYELASPSVCYNAKKTHTESHGSLGWTHLSSGSENHWVLRWRSEMMSSLFTTNLWSLRWPFSGQPFHWLRRQN